MNFWENVDLLREYKNLSRKELAYLAKFSVNSISTGIIRGSIPAADVAYRIAKILNVSIEYLLTGTDARTDGDYSELEFSTKYLQHHDLIDAFEVLPENVQKTVIALLHDIVGNLS